MKIVSINVDSSTKISSITSNMTQEVRDGARSKQIRQKWRRQMRNGMNSGIEEYAPWPEIDALMDYIDELESKLPEKKNQI